VTLEETLKQSNPKNRRKAAAPLPPSTGRDPFTVLDTEYFPKPSSTWTNALEGINQSRGCLVTSYDTNPSFNRFALPDPHYLVYSSSGNDQKRISYLFAWLKSRPSLIYQARTQMTLSHRASTWRQYFEMVGRDSGHNEESRSGKVRSQIHETYTFLLSRSDFQLASATAPGGLPVRWRGIQVLVDQPLIYYKPVFREVTWELNECNFRLEFFSLDCLVCSLGQDSKPSARIHEISRCFEPREFLPPTLPSANANTGLVADEWETRLPYVLAFVAVLKTWKGFPSCLCEVDCGAAARSISEDLFLRIEEEASSFYC